MIICLIKVYLILIYMKTCLVIYGILSLFTVGWSHNW